MDWVLVVGTRFAKMIMMMVMIWNEVQVMVDGDLVVMAVVYGRADEDEPSRRPAQAQQQQSTNRKKPVICDWTTIRREERREEDELSTALLKRERETGLTDN
jgi:hypothetical protein